jgi:hypothetical protein
MVILLVSLYLLVLMNEPMNHNAQPPIDRTIRDTLHRANRPYIPTRNKQDPPELPATSGSLRRLYLRS